MFNDSITGMNGTVTVLNSQLDTSAPNANIDDPNTCKEFKIANSKICGASAEGVKLFNNFDCNFDPIPNQ
jgi:hypothetical protein